MRAYIYSNNTTAIYIYIYIYILYPFHVLLLQGLHHAIQLSGITNGGIGMPSISAL
jgi:hypothetical protein